MDLPDERRQYAKLFGLRLEELRVDRGFTKKDLWKAVGISYNTGCGYLKGEVEPTLYIIYRICRVLECSADELLDPELDIFKSGDVKHRRFSSPDFEVHVMSRTGLLPTMATFGEDGAMVVTQTPYILKKSEE